MICPNCSITLQNHSIEDVVIDECPQCGGLWFDRGELDDAKDQIAPDARWMTFELWKEREPERISGSGLQCLRCPDAQMTRMEYHNPGVTFALCAQCRGTWIEIEDFQRLLRAMLAEAEDKSVSDYVRTSLREAADLFRHPGNLPSEWRHFKAVVRLLNYRIFVENPTLKNILLGIQKSLPL